MPTDTKNPLTMLFTGDTGATSTKKTAKKSSARRSSTAKKSSKRELIVPRGDKRYVRRDSRGRIKESDEVSRSLSQDRRRQAKRKAPKGERDRGD